MKEIFLPQFGMGMTEGLITRWHKSVGDPIEAGEPLCDVETAKTTVEMQAPVAGTLTRILIPADRSVPVNTCIALVDDGVAKVGVADAGVADVELEPGAQSGEARPAMVRGGNRDSGAKTTAQVEPRARSAARTHSVDLAAIKGTGPGGRITERDVLAAANPDAKRQPNRYII